MTKLKKILATIAALVLACLSICLITNGHVYAEGDVGDRPERPDISKGDFTEITAENFFDYFDADGNYIGQGHRFLALTGDFSNIGLDAITFDGNTTGVIGVYGIDSTFRNISFNCTGKGISLYDLNIINTEFDKPAINVYESELTAIDGCSIECSCDSGCSLYGIQALNSLVYIYDSNITLINKAEIDDGSSNYHAIHIDNKDISGEGDIDIIDNIIDIESPAYDMSYDYTTQLPLPRIAGIGMFNVNQTAFKGNKISIHGSKGFGNFPTVVGIFDETAKASDEDFIQLYENNIEVDYRDVYSSYVYDIETNKERLVMKKNVLYAKADFAAELASIEPLCQNVSLEENTFVAEATSVYGVYANDWAETMDEFTATNNSFALNAETSCYGIYGYTSRGVAKIKCNELYIKGPEDGDCVTKGIFWDGNSAGNEILENLISISGKSENVDDIVGIEILHGVFKISDNIIESNGWGVITQASENTEICGNTILGNDEKLGDDGVKCISGCNVHDNLPFSLATDTDATLSESTYNYTGEAVNPIPTVVSRGKTLTLDKDYEYFYTDSTGEVVENPVDAGKYNVTISGKGDYRGIVNAPFEIKPVKISSVTLKAASMAYSGKNRTQTPTVTAKVNGKVVTLTKGTKTGATGDYYLTFSNNLNVGTAKMVVTGKGNYTGSITKTFKIVPKGTTFSSLKAISQGITFKWNPVTDKMSKSVITGYQIQIATDKNFTQNKKTYTVKGYKMSGKKVTGLKSKKTYYVRIRTYKTVSGVNYYSSWNTVRGIKTK